MSDEGCVWKRIEMFWGKLVVALLCGWRGVDVMIWLQQVATMAATSCQVSSAITFLKTDGRKKATWLVDEVAMELQLVPNQVTSMCGVYVVI